MSVQQKSFYLTWIAALHFLSASWAKIRIASSTSETPPQTVFFRWILLFDIRNVLLLLIFDFQSSRYDFWDHIPVKSMNRVEAPNTPTLRDPIFDRFWTRFDDFFWKSKKKWTRDYLSIFWFSDVMWYRIYVTNSVDFHDSWSCCLELWCGVGVHEIYVTNSVNFLNLSWMARGASRTCRARFI